jgi:carbamoyl-phosphate synthase large subunit
MMGATLEELGVKETEDTTFFAVKESVFPFSKFPGVDVILGPEMRSTGEVMGADRNLPIAFAKAQMAAGVTLPTEGNVFFSLRESDKRHAADIGRALARMGFSIFASSGTHIELAKAGVTSVCVPKISEGGRPNVLDLVRNRQINLILNTAKRRSSDSDGGMIRSQAVRNNIPIISTVAGARAAVQAMSAIKLGPWGVCAVQDYFPHLIRGGTRSAPSVNSEN